MLTIFKHQFKKYLLHTKSVFNCSRLIYYVTKSKGYNPCNSPKKNKSHELLSELLKNIH